MIYYCRTHLYFQPVQRHKFSYPQCTCQDHLCCLYASNTLLSIYYWCQVVNIWHILTDLAITGNILCYFTLSDLICDVPLTRNFNLDAEDGNSASKVITWWQSDTHFFSACISIRQKTFLHPQTKQCLLPMSCDASKCWSAFTLTRTASTLTSNKYNFHHEFLPVVQLQLFLTNNLLKLKIISWRSLIHTTTYRFFPQHILYVHRCRQSCIFSFVIDLTLCTVLSFGYWPYSVYSPFLLLQI
jgi:hypothetical protein